MTSPEKHWHLDKRVPITLIVTILAQTFVFGWMASSINSQVRANAQAINFIHKELERRRTRIDGNTVDVAVIQEQLKSIISSQAEFHADIDRIEEALKRIEKQTRNK